MASPRIRATLQRRRRTATLLHHVLHETQKTPARPDPRQPKRHGASVHRPPPPGNPATSGLEAACRWLPTTPSSSAWRPGARNHALPRQTVGAALSFCTNRRSHPSWSCFTPLSLPSGSHALSFSRDNPGAGASRRVASTPPAYFLRTPVLLLPPLLLPCEIRPLLPLNYYQNLRM